MSERTVKSPALGDGLCAGKWDKQRLRYKECNKNRCKVANVNETIKCNQDLDIIILLDGTPKSGQKGWAAEVKAANLIVDAFKGTKAKPQFSVLQFSGPRTWSGVKVCTEKSAKSVDMEKDCHVKFAQHFTGNLNKVKNAINGLKYQPGSKLLSLALMASQNELPLGRPEARTVLIVFIDGEPLSFRKTLLTARSIRTKARMQFVAISKFSPLGPLKLWSSRRWEENLVQVETPEELASPVTGTHVIANICPSKFPKVETKVPKGTKKR